MSDLLPGDYTDLLGEIKRRVRSAQYEALKSVNKELIALYWDIGRMIVERQEGDTWGRSVIERLATDLREAFPGIGGFSSRNIWYMRDLYLCYREKPKLQPLVAGMRLEGENPSIGIILCKGKNKTVVEYALRESHKPIGVAQYRMVSTLPAELRGQLPEPEQIARLLEDVG